MKVVVIGAGLGGLTLAHGLRRAGIDVVVYERDAASGRPQGVSLHVDERGMTALRACLPPAHVAMVEATTGGPRERTLTLSDVDGELTAEAGRARPGRQVHRPLLKAVLLTDLDDVVSFGAEFTRFEQRADGTVRVWFADGRTDTADVLVGADGIGSAVRRRYLPDVQVVDTGRRMIMGAAPLRAVLGTGLPGLIGDNPASAHIRGTTIVVAVLRFTESRPSARRRWLPPPAPWPVRPITLLGDAIHLAPGFGGNLAMQDARHLCEALADAHRGRLGVLDAIGTYKDMMRRNGFTSASAKAGT
ncbi:FAD-dependent oxidoreductase [Amycolatopsis sp. NPDC102389]|uniref:FAD-dependent oxidoreductase n=1 Tax=Amycolatopsis sp. NPDC102389 TaxID=3363941 RepID=UPI0038236F2A